MVTVSYETPHGARLTAVLSRDGLVERMAAGVHAAFALPEKIDIQFVNCARLGLAVQCRKTTRAKISPLELKQAFSYLDSCINSNCSAALSYHWRAGNCNPTG